MQRPLTTIPFSSVGLQPKDRFGFRVADVLIWRVIAYARATHAHTHKRITSMYDRAVVFCFRLCIFCCHNCGLLCWQKDRTEGRAGKQTDRQTKTEVCVCAYVYVLTYVLSCMHALILRYTHTHTYAIHTYLHPCIQKYIYTSTYIPGFCHLLFIIVPDITYC